MTNDEIGQRLRECRKMGAITPEMWRAFDRLAAAKLWRLSRWPQLDDAVQDARIRFFARWKKIDPDRKPAAYLGNMIRSALSTRLRNEKNYRNHLRQYGLAKRPPCQR